MFAGIVFLLVSLFLIIAPFILNINVDKLETGRLSLLKKSESMILVPSDSSATQVISSDDNRSANIEKKSSYGNRSRQNKANIRESKKHQKYYKGTLEIEVKGYMTINEVSGNYDVPADYLKKELNLPLSISNNERFGQLRKVYGFQMHEIENIINIYHKSEVDEK